MTHGARAPSTWRPDRRTAPALAPVPLRARSAAASQRGAALLTAMVIVVLVSTLASAMVWQQWRAVQVEAAERARTQAAWVLSGALDWARLILREDARTSQRTGDGTRLGEPWSYPLAEARLSSFLAADKEGDSDDGPPAFLSGSIADAQAKYNLRNLVSTDKTIAATNLAIVQTLFESIGVAPELANAIATGLRSANPLGAGGTVTGSSSADSSAGGGGATLMPQRLLQLAWFGVDEASLARMAPFVTLLPANAVSPTPVNLNTAPREVLAAVLGIDLAAAERLRQRAPFKTPADAATALGGMPLSAAAQARVGVLSYWFEVRGRLRLEDRVLEESSLVQRNGLEVFTAQRERVGSRDAGG